MKFLNAPPRYLFFTGKGGVGKTSIACATAVGLADAGSRVLLVSTDPASNVGQVFGVTIGNSITAIPAVQGLSALEIDPHGAAAVYRERIVGPVRGVLPESVVRGIEEQLSGACTTEIAAFDEFTALLTDSVLTAEFQYIVFDTAPTGHTIRLLQLPGAWTGFLESGKGDASCLGPLAGLEKQRSQYQAAVEALADANRSRLILVARAQRATLREVTRTHKELSLIGLKNQYLVINGVFPKDEVGEDSLAAAIYQREQRAIVEIPEEVRNLPCDFIPLKAFNLVGLPSLRSLFVRDSDFASSHTGFTSTSSEDKQFILDQKLGEHKLSKLLDEIAATGHGLVMFMGKGGVGKTTLAAAVAVGLAERSLAVHLTTSDPAAHLTETLERTPEETPDNTRSTAKASTVLERVQRNLTVSRIDPEAETARYRNHVLETKGAELDSQGRAMLEEDLRSPCTEEIAVFQAFSRVIREAGEKFVVMDTAPTGHTLLLLDATGAYHREVTRQMSSAGDTPHFTTPMMRLQDHNQTKVLLVTLAETTPVLEAANLQADLRRAGIEPWAWVINECVAATAPSSPLLVRRAHNEIKEIESVATSHATRFAVVPMLNEEPLGVEKLLRDVVGRETS